MSMLKTTELHVHFNGVILQYVICISVKLVLKKLNYGGKNQNGIVMACRGGVAGDCLGNHMRDPGWWGWFCRWGIGAS